MGILTGPVGIAVMVIIRYWRQITGAITGVFSGLAKPVAAAFDAVKSVITGGFDKWWASHGAQIKQVWSGLWKAISAVFHFFWDPLAAALRQSVAAFAVIFSVGLAAVRKVVSVYLAAVLVVFRFYIALWSAVFKTVFAVISALAIGFFKLLQAYAKAGLATVQLIFKSAWAVIQGIVRIALAVITTGAKIAFALWKALFKTAFDVIVGIVSVALSLLTGHWSKAWHDMLNTGKQIWNNMRAAASAVVSALSGLWNTALSTAKSVWNKISGFFGTWWKGMKNAFSIGVSAIGRIWDGVKNAARIPIAFIINTVYDKGIVPVVNAVGGLIGLHLNAIKFAKGGRVREGTTSTADDVLARISKNETVVSAAHSKVLAPAFSAVGVPGYAAGGIPNPLTVIGNVASSALHGLESLAGNALASAAKLLLSPLLNAIPGTGTPIGKDLKKIPDTIISKVLGLMKASQFTSVAGIPYLGTTLPSLATMIKYFGPLGDPSRETSVPFAGHSVTVNKVLAGNVQAMGGQVGAAGYGPYIRDIGGFRTSKGASGGYIPFSMHQFGAAFDINEDGGPNGNWNTMTLPAKLVAIMSRNHWFCGQSWGGGSRDAGHFQFTGGGGAATGVGQAIVAGGPQMYAKSILSRYGWGPGQMDYLIPLWNQESGWRWNAMNPSSGAYGIPQSLPGSKMASAGADWRTNPDTQIRWGESYIKGRYGSPAGAWAHEKAYNWYDRGSWKVPSTGPAVVHAGEMILPADAAQRVRDSGGARWCTSERAGEGGSRHGDPRAEALVRYHGCRAGRAGMTFVSISLVDPVSGTVVPILPRAGISVNTLDIAASARAIELDRVDGHGTYDITRWLGSAAVSLTMQLWDDADSGQTAAGFWDELSMLLSPNLRPVLLCDNDAWDAPRQITLRFDSDTKPLSDPTVWPVQVSWKAPMAMWEAVVPAEYFINATIAGVTGLLFTSSGLIFAPAAGIVFTGTAQTAEAIVTNGAFDTQWQARLYGPCSGPVLGNDSAGQALVFQSGLTIAAGTTSIVIRCCRPRSGHLTGSMSPLTWTSSIQTGGCCSPAVTCCATARPPCPPGQWRT